MLIFLLFMGGHFELSQDGHPNRKNMRPIVPDDPNSEKCLILNGSGWMVLSTMWAIQEISSQQLYGKPALIRSKWGDYVARRGRALVALALICYFCMFYTIGLMRSETKEMFSVCPSKQQLQDYCTVMTGFGVCVVWFAGWRVFGGLQRPNCNGVRST